MHQPDADFALPTQFARIGFDKVMDGLDLKKSLKEDIFNLWLPAVRSGDPRKERDALFIHLGHHQWRWRALEEATSSFEEGMWPYRWQRWFAPPLQWDTMDWNTKLSLLASNLSGAGYAELHFQQMIDPAVQLVYRIVLASQFPQCPVEADFLKKYGRSIYDGNYSVRPPFYPGCGMYLDLVRR